METCSPGRGGSTVKNPMLDITFLLGKVSLRFQSTEKSFQKYLP